MAAVAALCLAAGARAAEIRDVTAKQRYPWNGLVDIRCTVAGLEEGVSRALVLSAEDADSGEVHDVSQFWVVRDGTNSSDRVVHANGECELLWDARADLGEVVCSNMVVRVTFDDYPMVRLWEGGPYWADRNIGAEEPWEYGHYYWWGDTVGYTWVDGQWVAVDGSATGFLFDNVPHFRMEAPKLLSNGWITTNDVLAPEHDAAQVKWGGGWRMPTEQELRDLCDTNKCERTWVTTNGVKGFVVRGLGDYASSSIFLPAAGMGWKNEWQHGDSWGHYWSSSLLETQTSQSWRLNFNVRAFYMDYHFDRHVGTPCRPVREGE
jgi:hypothetical protein